MTVAEFEQWQLPLDDACRYDLWDGKVIEMAPAGDAHGAIGTEIGRLVANYGRERRLGRTYMVETGFVLDEVRQRVLGPDVAFVRQERTTQPPQPGFTWPWSPRSRASYAPRGLLTLRRDLAPVEVRSPSNLRRVGQHS